MDCILHAYRIDKDGKATKLPKDNIYWLKIVGPAQLFAAQMP